MVVAGIDVNSPIGYCTNVHAGKDLLTTQVQLDTHATQVQATLGQPTMGIGLWLSQKTTNQLVEDTDQMERFAHWLSQRKLVPYTVNGFPFGDFHQDVVKHAVYLPKWSEDARFDYTKNLAMLLTCLLQHSGCGITHGTISTLPIGWPSEDDSQVVVQAASQFLRLVDCLSLHEAATGYRIEVCIEPEPGCVLGDMPSLIKFFNDHLLVGDQQQRSRVQRHLSVCYDICHAAVMNEDPEANLNALKASGIGVGKVQVSSAIEVDFDSLDSQQQVAAVHRLSSFAEPRYLHQTSVYLKDQPPKFFEDLPIALADSTVEKKGRWVVHFHVPICEASAGELGTTQQHIFDFIQAVEKTGVTPHHWEVETYAWNVLPDDMHAESLAAGISKEVAALRTWLGL